MEELKKDWITDGLIDFEYKKYVLLAYLKQVEEHFENKRLYPALSHLIDHYQDALHLKKNNEIVVKAMPKEVDRFDLNELRVVYKRLEQDENLMSEVKSVLHYAIPKMEHSIKMGREIYEESESQMSIEPIGIVPMYKDEGYVFMEVNPERLTHVFRFQIKKFILFNEQMRGVYFKWINRLVRGVGDSFEQLKMRLIQQQKDLPNPATFLIQSNSHLPMEETLIPLGKRLVLRTVKSMKS